MTCLRGDIVNVLLSRLLSPFGTNVVGQIIDINESWLEVQTKKGKELINAEYIQSIKVMDK